jgi:hypothetical protein
MTGTEIYSALGGELKRDGTQDGLTFGWSEKAFGVLFAGLAYD